MTGRQTGAAQLSPPKERAHTAGGWSPGLDSSSRPPSHPAYRTVTYLGACHPYSREGCCGFSPHSLFIQRKLKPIFIFIVSISYDTVNPNIVYNNIEEIYFLSKIHLATHRPLADAC